MHSDSINHPFLGSSPPSCQAARSHFEATWLSRLISWSNICSGQDALEGRLKLLQEAAQLYQSLGASVEILKKQSSAPLLIARFLPNHPRRIFLFGHLDTVFGKIHPFQSVIQENNILRGPGVCDMKSGVLIMYEALKKIQDLHLDIGWSVVLNTDEEIGSPISGPLWKELATGHFCALGFEPAITTSKYPRALAKSRMGSLNMRLTFKGKSAHPGRNPEEGASAIHAACRWWSGLEQALQGIDGLKFNAGKIEGGEGANIVAPYATMDINLRSANEDLVQTFFAYMQSQTEKLSAPLSLQTQILTQRPPKPQTQESLNLALLAVSIAKRLSLDISLASTAGVCDGNNIQALGIPTLDNLGAVGGGLHSDQEWVDLVSIEQQIEWVAALLEHLAKHFHL